MVLSGNALASVFLFRELWVINYTYGFFLTQDKDDGLSYSWVSRLLATGHAMGMKTHACLVP